ncbi:MAG: hypothetical protein N2171_04935 [Clostridia bacterium]|nr:hypothetical protein [Clostridia bacterium]
MYVQIKDGAVIQEGLPESGYLSDGSPVSNYDKLDESILKAEGWYPCEKIEPEYDAATQVLVLGSITKDDEAWKATLTYVAQDIVLDTTIV